MILGSRAAQKGSVEDLSGCRVHLKEKVVSAVLPHANPDGQSMPSVPGGGICDPYWRNLRDAGPPSLTPYGLGEKGRVI
jgi:hypothetical protein